MNRSTSFNGRWFVLQQLQEPSRYVTSMLCTFCSQNTDVFYIPQNKQRILIYGALTGFSNREGVFTARYELNILFALVWTEDAQLRPIVE